VPTSEVNRRPMGVSLLPSRTLLEHTGGYTPAEAKRVAGTLLPDVLPYDPTRPACFPDNGRTLTDDAFDCFHARSHEWQSQGGQRRAPRRFVTRVSLCRTTSSRPRDESCPIRRPQRKTKSETQNDKETTNMKDQNYAATKTPEIRLAKRSPEYCESR